MFSIIIRKLPQPTFTPNLGVFNLHFMFYAVSQYKGKKNVCILSDQIYFDSIIHVYLNCQTRSYTNLVLRSFNKTRHRQESVFSKFAYFFFRGGQYVPQVSMLLISNNWLLCKNVSTDLVMF
jgi:hypothetical protein